MKDDDEVKVEKSERHTTTTTTAAAKHIFKWCCWCWWIPLWNQPNDVVYFSICCIKLNQRNTRWEIVHTHLWWMPRKNQKERRCDDHTRHTNTRTQHKPQFSEKYQRRTSGHRSVTHLQQPKRRLNRSSFVDQPDDGDLESAKQILN